MNLPDERNGRANESRRTTGFRAALSPLPQWRTVVLTVVVLLASVAGTASASSGAVDKDLQPGFVVAVEPDGSARVSVVLTFDLTTDDERAGFEAVREDSENVTATFHDRFVRLADRASEETGRTMAVTEPTTRVYTTDGDQVGVVELAVTWEGLATRIDDGLVLSEPFADGFAPDRPFTIRGPEGYALADASPAPDESDGRSATWSAGSSLDGFRVTFEPASASTSTAAGIGSPVLIAGGIGLGILVAVLAVLRRR